jgi:chaperonin GroES
MNFTKIRPLLNRVVVKKMVASKKTQGGILLPETSNVDQKVGIVTEVGPGRHNGTGLFVKTGLKPGDYVLLPGYGGLKVPKKSDSEEELVIYAEDDILAVVNDNLNTKI